MSSKRTLKMINMRKLKYGCIAATWGAYVAIFGCNQSAPTLSISANRPQSNDLNAKVQSDALRTGNTIVSEPSQALQSAITTQADVLAAQPAPNDIDPEKISANGHPRRWWDAIYAGGIKIGWGETETIDLEQAGQKLIQVNSQSHLTVDRSGTMTKIDVVTRSTENARGELLGFTTRLDSGASHVVMDGKVEHEQLDVSTITQGKTTMQTAILPPGTLGFSATEQSLANSPLLPAARRILHALMPATNELVTIDLTAAKKYEPVTLLDHAEDLLEIDCAMTLPMHSSGDKPSVIRAVLWINHAGEVLKTAVAALNQETYRVPEEIALADTGAKRFDLVFDNKVPVAQSLADPHGTKRVRYRVQLAGDDPAKVFNAGPLETITSLDPHTAEITVFRADFRAKNAAAAIPLPTDEDRQPNNLIQSDDEQVVALAKSIAAEETDPATLAIALEKYIFQIVKVKNFSQTFDTAAEVARNREGDCTEHAVLLAAVARARGIPARVAIGLVYQAGTQSFAYHMWDELWIGDHWLPLDATLGRGGVGAAHLKLTDSSLTGAQAYSCFLPVAQVIGQLRIEILEVE
ncbi:MAG TPA: transglutaminase-like domain-containing protein [Pirellulales bacterium]